MRDYISVITILSSLILLSGCQSTPELSEADTAGSEEVTTLEIPAYSKLTQQETELTLIRLREIRAKLGKDRLHGYEGPIRHVWDRILAKPLIRYEDNLRIEKQATVMLRNPEFVKRVSLRAEPYIYYILEEIDKRNLPRELALLPVIESAYRPTAISRSRAAAMPRSSSPHRSP